MTKTIPHPGLRGALVVLMSWSCATPGAPARKYPPRSAGCELSFYSTPVPGVAAWDDLGVAEAACNINESTSECARGLRAEACRMGGDIVYNVPRQPLRPKDQVLLYRGQVAHSRSATEPRKSDPKEPPASEADATRPVVPFGNAESPPPPPAPAAALPPGLDLRLRGAMPPGSSPHPPEAGGAGVDSGIPPQNDPMPPGERG